MSTIARAFVVGCSVLITFFTLESERVLHAQGSPQPTYVLDVETRFSADVAKAESDMAKARKVAGESRLKAYKEKLSEATKAGDFDKAVGFKARIELLEKEPEVAVAAKPSKRPRPKDTVKFGGHTYALIKEPATWHVAKQRCEEMGGHLAVIETPEESAFVRNFCGSVSAWAGATDEVDEGIWQWVNATPFKLSDFTADNTGGQEHALYFAPESKSWKDWSASGKLAYVCEWER